MASAETSDMLHLSIALSASAYLRVHGSGGGSGKGSLSFAQQVDFLLCKIVGWRPVGRARSKPCFRVQRGGWTALATILPTLPTNGALCLIEANAAYIRSAGSNNFSCVIDIKTTRECNRQANKRSPRGPGVNRQTKVTPYRRAKGIPFLWVKNAPGAGPGKLIEDVPQSTRHVNSQ